MTRAKQKQAEDSAKIATARSRRLKKVDTVRGDESAAPTETKVDPEGPEPAVFTQVTRPELAQYRVELGYGADVYFQKEFLSSTETQEWYDTLLALDTYQPTLKLYGRTITQSRQIAAYSTGPMNMKYSGAEIDVHHPFPPALEAMRLRVQADLGITFNHVLLNRYDDGSVYIGRHSDTKDNGVVVSVSLGAERTFIMSPRLPAKNARVGVAVPASEAGALAKRKNVKWQLTSGSLLVMQGSTQEFWKHEIPREAGVKAGRISLTFRQLS